MNFTPLKANLLASLLKQEGFYINPEAEAYMGKVLVNGSYIQGSITKDTVLRDITESMFIAFRELGPNSSIYNKLLNLGITTVPALANTKPKTYTKQFNGHLARYGFLRLIPRQAFNELTAGNYSRFVSTFTTAFGKKTLLNNTIQTLEQSKTFLDGVYSNMNDLITCDITGVNQSTFYWGQDLINLGKALDLEYIDRYGEPIVLLKTLSKSRAISKALNLLLLSIGLTSDDIDTMLATVSATDEQQKLIYAALFLIQGEDLEDILIPLNCQTRNLESLADLLNLKKIFPSSYKSLTYPIYNAIDLPSNSKTYYLIFKGDQPNIDNSTIRENKLFSILPRELAFTSSAFRHSMMQIKNIKNVNILKFSQVVTNLENVNNLEFVNGTNIPSDSELIESVQSMFAKGSGIYNQYTMCDYFGAMTNLHYKWKELQEEITGLQTQVLSELYSDLLAALKANNISSIESTIIPKIEKELEGIFNSKRNRVLELNKLYEEFGMLLLKEQDARTTAIANITNNPNSTPNSELDNTQGVLSDESDIITFVQQIDSFSKDTKIKGASLVLESIANRNIPGGNYLIAALREARNKERLGLAGLIPDNDITSLTLSVPRKSNATLNELPLENTGNTIDSGKDYLSNPTSDIQNLPIATGKPSVPGSLVDSSETTIIPTNLNILVNPSIESITNPNDAVENVILCNCDCWDKIKDMLP
jgi:hypothetical protein